MIAERIAGFMQWMREQDFNIGVGESLDALHVAEHCLLDPQRLRWGLRSLLCGTISEWQRFDVLFDAYWLPNQRHERTYDVLPATLAGSETASQNTPTGSQAEGDQAQTGGDDDSHSAMTRHGASHQESALRCDFRLFVDPQQMLLLEQMAERLARKIRKRLLRRLRMARYGRRMDLRRTIRCSLSYGGIPLQRWFKRRRQRLPRLVLLLDVSRSMRLYSYMFLRFAKGLLGAFGDAQAFIYHTRLVPISDALREPNTEQMKEKLALIALGWSGGTRIGESLQCFNQQYAQHILNSRSILVIVSDGFDTGAPELLVEQLQYIRQRARKIIWLNPLLGLPGYQPLAAGMAAALPWLDVFAPAHNLAALAALEPLLAKI